MKLIDASVPIDASFPTHPGKTPFGVVEGPNPREVEAGVYEMICLPLRVVDADGAPACVVLGRH